MQTPSLQGGTLLAKSLIELQSSGLSLTGETLIKSSMALRNTRLQRKQILIHGAQGQLFYQERLVSPEEAPKTRARSVKTPLAPRPVANSDQMSLFGGETPQFQARPRPKANDKSRDGGTLSLFDTPPQKSENKTHEPTNTRENLASPNAPERDAPAPVRSQRSGASADAAADGPRPLRDGIRPDVDALPERDGRGLDSGRDAGQPRPASAGRDGAGNRHLDGAGLDAPRSEPRSDQDAPATAEHDGLNDKIRVDEAHHYENGRRARGAAPDLEEVFLSDERAFQQLKARHDAGEKGLGLVIRARQAQLKQLEKLVYGEAAPDEEMLEVAADASAPSETIAAQNFEGDQTQDVRAAGIGQSAPDGESPASAEPLHAQTPVEIARERAVASVVARGLSEAQKSGADLVLTDADAIGTGSLGQKARDNFAALDLLKELEVEDREPTEDEKRVLARYVGWGAFGQAFQDSFEPYADKEWDEIPDTTRKYRFTGADKAHFELYKQIQSRLGASDFASARASINNAHYTAPAVVKAMWQGLQHLGFTGGRVLEPSCGTGNFFGFMPPELEARSKRVGVELDTTSGKIARLLYPASQIHIKGFEEAPLADDSFDLAIGNVPFGDYGVSDAEYVKQGRKYQTARIHNYYFSKALDKVKPGGVVAFITSAGTLDAPTSAGVREAWAEKADFLGAVRLPNDAFSESAGTKVTTDIVFLQKRDLEFEALHPRDAQGHFISKWTGTQDVKMAFEDTRHNPDAYKKDVPVNEYFAARPEMMLGQMAIGAGLYRADQAGLVSDGRDIATALPQALEQLPKDVIRRPDAEARAAFDAQNATQEAAIGIKPGAFDVDAAGTIAVNRFGRLVPLEADPTARDAKKRERIVAQFHLLSELRDHLGFELQNASDTTLGASRELLNDKYDAFVQKFGVLHDRQNVAAFASDPDAGLLLSLEHKDKETGAIHKADIFTRRTITPQSRAQSASSPTDALGIVLNEEGEINWQRLSELLNRDPESIRDELATAGLIFRDPAAENDPVSAGWQTADAYLSGEVKAKLETARGVAQVDPSYAGNVAALEAVQPAPLLPSQVEVRLGSPWVPPSYLNQFVKHLLGDGHNSELVNFSKHSGWTIEALHTSDGRRGSPAMTSKWGTKDVTALDILDDTLNLRDVTVTKPSPDDPKRRVVDTAGTLAAREKQTALKAEWRRFIEADAERHQEITDLYNSLFNTTAPRAFDGSHLTFPGMNAHFAKGFRAHARNAVWRAIQTGNCLFDHVVGGGKTGCIAATAMELRRLGLAKKPMIVVRNPQLEQWEREFREIYPNARLLVISEGMGNAQKRKELTAKIATGDWDAVIVAQSTFKEIPASPKLYQDFISEQLAELREALREENEKGGNDKKRKKSQKKIESSIKSLEARLKNMQTDVQEHQDDGIPFDELGIDSLLVDECHDFKNLQFATRMGRVAGLNPDGSEKAMDMFVKSQHLLSKNKGRGLIFATGTPVSNSLSEMWTMKRYLMLPKLRELGFDRFDSWAATFGDTVTSVEKAPEGGFRQRTRFARFVNVPEMIALYRSVADVKTREDLKDILPTPALETGAPIINTAPASPALAAYMDTLQERAKKLQTGRVDPRDDNFLKITSDGRKAALDMRLVDPDAPHDPRGKVALCAQNAARLHRESGERRATQLIFLDLGTPQGQGKAKSAAKKLVGKIKTLVTGEEESAGGELDAEEERLQSSVYADLKAKIVAQGVPENEVAFAHDFNTPAKRKEMSRLMDTGQLRVLIGSTPKMGVGLNVQKRLFAVHHLDCPWKPGELEQRDGRIMRQGNWHHESKWNVPIQIHRYGTQNSFDEYMWQAVAKKASFIAQTRRGECARVCEDMDETVMTAASMQAALSDNPLMGEKADVDAKAYTLTQLRRAYLDNRFSVQRKLAALPVRRDNLLAHAADRDAAARVYNEHRGGDFALTVGGHTFSDRDAAGAALAQAYQGAIDDVATTPGGVKVGHYCGFDVYARLAPSHYDEFDSLESNVALEMRTSDGKGRHFLHVGSSASGTTTRIDNNLKGLAGEAEAARREVAQIEAHIQEYGAEVNKPFEREEELTAALTRQAQIEAELAKGGDADTVAGETVAGETVAGEDGDGSNASDQTLQKSQAAFQSPAQRLLAAFNVWKNGREELSIEAQLEALRQYGQQMSEQWK